jgi:BASS family bile acid:Na+ symporter
MTEILTMIARVSVLIFVVGSMLALGLSLSVGHIIEPLKDVKRVALALVGNFVLVPLVLFGILLVIPVEEGVRIGLILLAAAGGAPFLPKLVQVAKGDVAFSVGLMLLLMVGTVIYMPLALPFLLQGDKEVEVDALQIIKSLITTMLIPLGIGLVLRAKAELPAAKLQFVVVKLANLSLIVLTVLLVVLNFKNILSMVGLNGLAILCFIFASLAVGFLLGGREPASRSVMGLGTGQRNIAAALVVAGKNFKDPEVLVTLIVTAIVGLLIFMPLGKVLGGKMDKIGKEG